MAKRKHHRKAKAIRPDNEFTSAGTTIRQFGRFIEIHTHRTPEEQALLDTHQAGMYSEVCKEIDEAVGRIRSLVSSYDPLDLLCYGYWALCSSMVGKEAESDYGFEDGVYAAMVDYVQSVIVSTPPAETTRELTDEAWASLFAEVRDLYERLFIQFHIVNRAHLKATRPDYDLEHDAFCVQAQTRWTFVRGVRYAIHDPEFLSDFLSPHDDVFQRLFGISVHTLIDAIEAIHGSLCRDSMSAFEELREEHAKFLSSMEAKEGQSSDAADLGAALSQMMQDGDMCGRMASIAGRILGLDLFDLRRVTSLPTRLLDELSFEPGEDTSFFAAGPYAGWPLRVLPIKVRPFIKFRGRHYCFDFINIMDDIYRVTQRLVCRLEPGYQQAWNHRQKEASERRPLELLCELLPGATVYNPVHYEHRPRPGQSAQWCELDGLVLFDDIMLVVEVKAGAFTWTPPSTDFPAYLQSLKALLQKPAEQAARFLDYLDSGDAVPIHDAEHKRTATVATKDYRLIVPVCISLDALTAAAHQIAELKPVGIAVPRPVCSLSIDDLRVFRDVFDSSVAFAHFLLKRYEAEREPEVHVTDQLDHVGLYLEFLDYVDHAKELSAAWGTGVDHWPGYRDVLDRYFYQVGAGGEPPHKPSLPIGEMLSAVLGKLDASARPGRSSCAAALLDMAPTVRKGFDNQVAQSLARSRQRGQASPFHVQGRIPITVFLDAPGVAPQSLQDRTDCTLAWMLGSGSQERLLVMLTFDDETSLVGVDWQFLRLHELTHDDRSRIARMYAEQPTRRLARQLEANGRVGRNAPCPCGSGKKYKRCCGKHKG